ncbi:MAG: ATP-dependent metallopeptidase FtsH/Yme1/Tma family protein, partial [Planctomycetia bacterium]
MEPRKKNPRETSWRDGWRQWLPPALLLVAVVLMLFQSPDWFTQRIEIGYGRMKRLVKEGQVERISLAPAEILGKLRTEVADDAGRRQGRDFRTPRYGVGEDPNLIPLLEENNVAYQAPEEPGPLNPSFLWMLVVLSVVTFAFFIIFRRLSNGGPAMAFGRSKHKLYAQDDLHITFDDVAGIDEAVEELREVVDFLKTPEKYQAIGGRIPKGVL